MRQKTKIIILVSAIFGGIIIALFGGRIFLHFREANRTEKILCSPREIEIQIFEGKINPPSFKVKPKEMVVLTVTSLEGKHSFTFIDHPMLNWVRAEFEEPGETQIFTFYAPHEVGEYQFFCTREGHRAAGEEGVMIVE